MSIAKRAIAGIGVTIALFAAAPLTASAAPAPTHGTAGVLTSYCGTGRVASIAANLPIRSTPFLDAPLIETVQKGDQFNCSGAYYVTDRYDACGVSQANGWLELHIGSDYGYTYMTCLKDVTN